MQSYTCERIRIVVVYAFVRKKKQERAFQVPKPLRQVFVTWALEPLSATPLRKKLSNLSRVWLELKRLGPSLLSTQLRSNGQSTRTQEYLRKDQDKHLHTVR